MFYGNSWQWPGLGATITDQQHLQPAIGPSSIWGVFIMPLGVFEHPKIISLTKTLAEVKWFKIGKYFLKGAFLVPHHGIIITCNLQFRGRNNDKVKLASKTGNTNIKIVDGAGLLCHSWFSFFLRGSGRSGSGISLYLGCRAGPLPEPAHGPWSGKWSTRSLIVPKCPPSHEWSLWRSVEWRWALQEFPINCTVMYYLKLDHFFLSQFI